jgi:hypothetical protein
MYTETCIVSFEVQLGWDSDPTDEIGPDCYLRPAIHVAD